MSRPNTHLVVLSLLLLAVAVLFWRFPFGLVSHRYQSAACKQQGIAYQNRLDKLQSDAHAGLRIGTHREDVLRFFQEHGLPVSFDKQQSEYEGTIYTKGCAPAGCGSDDALLGLR